MKFQYEGENAQAGLVNFMRNPNQALVTKVCLIPDVYEGWCGDSKGRFMVRISVIFVDTTKLTTTVYHSIYVIVNV